MSNYIVRAATVGDALRIAPLLRKKDRREVQAASGKSPGAVLPLAFAAPSADILFAETREGAPIMIAGVHQTAPNVAAIWLLGTKLLDDYAFPLTRVALKHIEEWHKTYPLLWNAAWEDNDLHVKWLTFMGFSFLRRFDRRGYTFIEFVRHRNV